MIKLHTPDGLPFYVSVAQLVTIRPMAGDGPKNANAWIDLTSSKPLATRETADEILKLLAAKPVVAGDSTV